MGSSFWRSSRNNAVGGATRNGNFDRFQPLAGVAVGVRRFRCRRPATASTATRFMTTAGLGIDLGKRRCHARQRLRQRRGPESSPERSLPDGRGDFGRGHEDPRDVEFGARLFVHPRVLLQRLLRRLGIRRRRCVPRERAGDDGRLVQCDLRCDSPGRRGSGIVHHRHGDRRGGQHLRVLGMPSCERGAGTDGSLTGKGLDGTQEQRRRRPAVGSQGGSLQERLVDRLGRGGRRLRRAAAVSTARSSIRSP